MSKMIPGSINLSKIPKEAITTAKNGDKYLNIVIWLNDTKDQYGNDGSIQLSQTKEQRESKAPKVYLGNVKLPEQKQAEQTFVSNVKAEIINDPYQDLPF